MCSAEHIKHLSPLQLFCKRYFFFSKVLFNAFWMFLMITNVEFLHQRSCSLTRDDSCDYPKIYICLC